MNYGVPNDSPQPIIAPSSSVPLSERIRPAWLCIDSPEHCRSGISEKEVPELTDAEIAEAEAEELRRSTIRLLKINMEREEKEQAKWAEQRERNEARHAISKKRQSDYREAKFSEILQNIREARKLSRVKLAKELECSAQSIANWETGRFGPTLKMQAKILALQ
jgi:DNA-binding XRE family transcriptional regulator